MLALVVAILLVHIYHMSSFSLNLSSLSLAGARERLARHDAAGGSRLPRLLLPGALFSHGDMSASSARLNVDRPGLGAVVDGLGVGSLADSLCLS